MRKPKTENSWSENIVIKHTHQICERDKTEKSKYQEFLFLRIEYIGMTFDKTSLLLLSLLDSKSTNHTNLKINKKHAPKWKTIQLLLMWVYIRTSCCSKGTYKSAQKSKTIQLQSICLWIGKSYWSEDT